MERSDLSDPHRQTSGGRRVTSANPLLSLLGGFAVSFHLELVLESDQALQFLVFSRDASKDRRSIRLGHLMNRENSFVVVNDPLSAADQELQRIAVHRDGLPHAPQARLDTSF
jgi:hypothetical protein